MPCRFAQQFEYNQLYIGNPNLRLRFSGNLFEGARAWYYSVAGGTGAIFTLPHKTPNFYASFSFYSWYFMANQVPGFGINTSYIRGIKSTYKTKLGSKGCRMRGMDEFQAAEKEERGESKREVSLTGTAAVKPEPQIVTTKEQPARKSRRAMAKRSRGSASQGESRPKKARKGSEAEVSMPEVVPASAEEQEEEEEEKGEVLTLRS